MIKHKKNGIYTIRSIILLMVLYNTAFAQGQFSVVGCRLPYEASLPMHVVDDKLYNASIFEVCGDTVHGIGVWNGSDWTGIGANAGILYDPARSFVRYKNELYVGGGFPFVFQEENQIRVNSIAKWNTGGWDTLTSRGFNNYVNCMLEYKGELYIGGKFTEVDNKAVRCIVKWDGAKYIPMPGVWSDFTSVNCMAIYKGELYVAGHFWYMGGKPSEGGKPASFIARWNGTEWKTVGQGTNSEVVCMVVDTVRDVLYVGGFFGVVDGGNVLGRVAMWDGIQWHQLGVSPNILRWQPGAVMAMDLYKGYLYVGGLAVHGQTDTVLARWDGQHWEPLLGINNGITSMKTYRDKLYMGGFFTRINGDTIPYLASFYSEDSVVLGVEAKKPMEALFKVYPNPATSTLEIDYHCDKNCMLKIEDLIGKVMAEHLLDKGYNTKTIDISHLEAGIYFMSVYDHNDNRLITKKIVKSND